MFRLVVSIFSLSTFMLLGMPPSYLSDVLLRHSMQHYSVEMFSRALATIDDNELCNTIAMLG